MNTTLPSNSTSVIAAVDIIVPPLYITPASSGPLWEAEKEEVWSLLVPGTLFA